MKRMIVCKWLGITLLGAVVGCGSTRNERYADAQAPRGVALVYASSNTASQSPRAYKPTPMQHTQIVQVGHQASAEQADDAVVYADHVVVEGADQEPPIIQASASVPTQPPVPASPYAAPAPSAAPASNPGQWAPIVQHVVPSRASGLHGETIPTRRDVHDITASPCFAKAADYSWLQGQVEYSRLSKSWRLRYASVDEVDKFGGSVTLTGDTLLDSLKDGQHIRVKGYLPNPEARGIAPSYRVEAIEAIDSK